MRCNLIRHDHGVITSHNGMAVSATECMEIINDLNENLGSKDFEFYTTGDFRCLLILRDCSADVAANPTHTLVGSGISDLLISSDDPNLTERLNGIIINSRKVLAEHTSNGISLWAPGRPMRIHRKIRGAVVAGVNIIKGIGRAVGLTVLNVAGVTGDEHTDYTAKLHAAINALDDYEFVLLHIESPDEASHQRDCIRKVRILEEIDRRLLAPLLNQNIDLDITVQADHVTSSLSGQHLDWPVEVVQYKLRKNEE